MTPRMSLLTRGTNSGTEDPAGSPEVCGGDGHHRREVPGGSAEAGGLAGGVTQYEGAGGPGPTAGPGMPGWSDEGRSPVACRCNGHARSPHSFEVPLRHRDAEAAAHGLGEEPDQEGQGARPG